MHTITWEQNGIHFDIGEGFSIDEVTHAILEISSDERLDNIRYRITDYSKIHTIYVDEIHQIIAMFQIQSHFFNQCMLEVSVATHPIIIELLTQYRDKAKYPQQMKTCATLKEARLLVTLPANGNADE
jgi:hypothetical protein